MGISSRTFEKRGEKRKHSNAAAKQLKPAMIEETERSAKVLTDTKATAHIASSSSSDIKKKRKSVVTYFERGGQGKKLVPTHPTKEDKSSNASGAPSKSIVDSQRHRFGKVMSSVPCRKQPRLYTVSIAIPGSIVDNCQTKELKTCLVGQIARAATIYHVDEIIVYNDHLGSRNTTTDTSTATSSSSCQFMAKILQYCECPQYLRKHFFPLDADLQFVGVLSPVDAPHHVRVNDRCKYREGIVLDKIGPTGGSCVNVGIGEKSKMVELIDQLVLTPGVRCTVQMTDCNRLEAHHEPHQEKRGGKTHPQNQHIQVKVVSPRAPTLDDGTYWGYSVRIADSLQQAMDSCPFEGENYDLKVGTSERGDYFTSKLVQNTKKGKKIPNFKHMIIVFGGISGIEEVSICTPFSCLLIMLFLVVMMLLVLQTSVAY